MSKDRPTKVLYSVVCGAGPAKHVAELVSLAQARGWDVHCIATPAAVEHFLDVCALRTHRCWLG